MKSRNAQEEETRLAVNEWYDTRGEDGGGEFVHGGAAAR
jgi:hypothetical protein